VKRVHIVGRKNHGKTMLITELMQVAVQQRFVVGSIKHTHHHHELDVVGKDSHRHRMAGAAVVGIISPSTSALFLSRTNFQGDRYAELIPQFRGCDLLFVEGDASTSAPKIEVWRGKLDTAPLASTDPSILALVTDDANHNTDARPILPRRSVPALLEWILREIPASPHEP
jgi:molybdopterin-guanine dinucleotide biosynthesis adapter protein